MNMYTKRRDIIQYTEIVYLKDGVEFARDAQCDATLYDSSPEEPMTEDEIEDWY